MRNWIPWTVPGVLALSGPVQADVVFNEVLADPASDWNGDGTVHSRDDEWIEIVNDSETSIDLAGVRIASADTAWRYEFSGTLAAHTVRVVYGHESYAWEQETGNPAYGLRLSNTGGTITLWRLTESDTLLVDQVEYLDAEAEDDRSGGRPASSPDEWLLFDALNPYTGDPPPYPTGCQPSPGLSNQCTLPVLDESWGLIKEIYGDFGRN